MPEDHEFRNGWEHAQAAWPRDPRIAPGISVPGFASAPADAEQAAVADAGLAVAPAPAAPTRVQEVKQPASGSMFERLKAMLAKAQADDANLQDQLKSLMEGQK